MNPLFISGIGRSGTSAVLSSLVYHRIIESPKRLGEAPFVSAFCEFLLQYENTSKNADYHSKNYCLDSKTRMNIFADMILKIQCDLNPNPEKIWVAKTSLTEEAYNKAEELFGSVRCIYIMRNGIEVINSAKNFAGFQDLSFSQLCDRWIGNIESCRYISSKANTAVIRHDQLVRAPHTTYSKVFKNINIPDDDGPADWIGKNIFNSSFDSTAKDVTVSSYFDTRLTDAWSEWTSSEKNTFIEKCGYLMEEFDFTRPYLKSTSTKHEIKNTKTTDTARYSVRSITEEATGGVIDPRVFDYVCNVSERYKYLFFNNAKVASSSLLKLMQQKENPTIADSMTSPHQRHLSPMKRLSHFKEDEQINYLFSENHYRFAFVRNPYARLLSAYKSKIEKPLTGFKFDPKRPSDYPPKGKIISTLSNCAIDENTDFTLNISFQQFVEAVCSQRDKEMDIHWIPQSTLLSIDKIKYAKIGRFESLAEDVSEIFRLLEIPYNNELSVSENKTNSTHLLHEYYTDELIQKVRDRYRDDFENFLYTYELETIDNSAAA